MPGYRKGLKPPNAGRKFPAEVLNNAEITALLEACPRRGPTGLRNRAIIILCWRCGLRIAEVLALEPRDIDVAMGTVTVRHGKGNQRRVLGLDAKTVVVLERWLAIRATIDVPRRSGPLFCTITRGQMGRPVRSAYFREALKSIARRAQIEKRVHPHGLRHTFAVNLLLEHVDVITIMKALGHNDLATTHRYLNHLYPEGLVIAMRSREWPTEARRAAASVAIVVACPHCGSRMLVDSAIAAAA